jgi:hypothetical protein
MSTYKFQASGVPMYTYILNKNYKHNIAAEKATDRITQETHCGQRTQMRTMDSPSGHGQRQSGHSPVVSLQSFGAIVP